MPLVPIAISTIITLHPNLLDTTTEHDFSPGRRYSLVEYLSSRQTKLNHISSMVTVDSKGVFIN